MKESFKFLVYVLGRVPWYNGRTTPSDIF